MTYDLSRLRLYAITNIGNNDNVAELVRLPQISLSPNTIPDGFVLHKELA